MNVKLRQLCPFLMDSLILLSLNLVDYLIFLGNFDFTAFFHYFEVYLGLEKYVLLNNLDS